MPRSTTSIRLPDDLVEALDERAAALGVTRNPLITKGKGKLKGTSVYTDPGSRGTWSYKLIDPSDPGATGCAP